MRELCVLPGTALDAPASDSADAFVFDVPPDGLPISGPPQFRSASGANAGTTTMAVAAPPGVVVGDLLLAHVSADGAVHTDIATPAGWTKIGARNGDSAHFISAYYRYATDPTAAYPWVFPNTSGAIRLMAFSSVDPMTPIDAFDTNALTMAEAPRAPGITTTQPDTMMVVMLTQDLSGVPLGPVPAMTPIYSEDVGALNMLGAYTPRPTAGATGPRTATTSDPGPSTAISVALAPN